MGVVFETLSGSLRKIVAVSSAWLPRPHAVSLSEDDRRKIIGRFRAEDGREFKVLPTASGFHIDGLSGRELIAISAETLYDAGDPEAIVRFERLRNRVYTNFIVTHPLRLSINARRV